MPLCDNEETHEMDSSTMKKGVNYWRISYTGEVYENYSEYLIRLSSYKEKKWACSLSGRRGMDYKEALECEKKIIKDLKNFPEEYLRIILSIAQHNTDRIIDICQKINKEVKELATRRNEKAPSRMLWKLKLKQCAHRHNFQRAPWVIHENIARRFGIWKPLPPELAERIEKHLRAKKQRMEPKLLRRSCIQTVKNKVTEDLLLHESLEKSCQIKDFSPVPKSLPMYSDIFLAYDFCQRASVELNIKQFTMAALEKALLSNEASELLLDINLCLLEALRKDCPAVLGYSSLKFFSMESLQKYAHFLMDRPMVNNPLADLNPITIASSRGEEIDDEVTESEEERISSTEDFPDGTQYFLVKDESEILPREILETESYWSLNIKQKVVILKFLMDRVMNSTVMREWCKKNQEVMMNNSSGAKREISFEMNKRQTRATVLGYDRMFRRYFLCLDNSGILCQSLESFDRKIVDEFRLSQNPMVSPFMDCESKNAEESWGWFFFKESENCVSELLGCLDERGVREAALKAKVNIALSAISSEVHSMSGKTAVVR